jgi:WD40 repeat protein
MDGPAGARDARCALVLGISGPDPGLGEAELGAPASLSEAPSQARGLAASLAAYGYRDVLETLGKSGAGLAAAADVQEWLGAALAEPGLVVVHLLTHGDPGHGETVLYVLGPDGKRVRPSLGEWLNQAEERGDLGPMLFVLDVCHAGKAVGYQLQQLVDAERQRAWVLAASSGADPAYDGRLTRALTQVLERFRSGELQIDPSMRYIPLNKLFGEVDRLVREQSRGSYPQQVHSTYVPLHAHVDQLEFFPNPGWDPTAQGNDARGAVADETAALLDEAFDERHFLRRAGAAEAVFGQVGRGFFHGRVEQLEQLRGWVMGTGPALRVVTGKQGVGKSALLGVVVCAAHPALRERTRDLWDRLPHKPPPLREGCLAVVHARRRTVVQVIASIARQWQLPVPAGPEGGDGEGESWTGQRLVAALGQALARPGGAGATRLLVVDAVDEADRPADLVAGVLVPLAAAPGKDGGPLCRMLIAGRDEYHLRPLIAAAATGGVTDLGAIPRRQVRPALAAYGKDLLGHGTPYETLPYAPAADALAEAVADALTAGPGAETDPAPLEWGEFLVAGLYIRHVLDLPPVQGLDQARELGEAVPRDLRGVLDLDFGRPEPGLDVSVLRAVAWALAFAEGTGMPEQIARHAAAAFLSSPMHPAAPSIGEIGKALARLRFYLRRDVDLNGDTLYRLFHQSLADQLRADAEENVTGPGPAAWLWQHLYAVLPAGPDRSRQWQHAEPYLLRHAAQHAVAAGRLEDLLQDTGFLTHAIPDTVAPLLAALPAGAADGAADTYRASYSAHSWAPPAARAQILAIDATRYRYFDLAQRLSSAAFWEPIWASCQSRSARLRLTLTDHHGDLTAVAVGRAGDRDIIVSGWYDHVARVWDALTGQPLGRPLIGHTGPVGAVAAGRAGDRDIIVSGSYDGTVRVWDAVTGQPVGEPLAGHSEIVNAVAVGRAGDRDIIVSGGGDETVRVWDAAAGQPLGAPLITRRLFGRARAVAAGRAGDRDIIVSGWDDSTVQLWDAATGQPVGELWADHTGRWGPVTAVAVGRAGNRDIIVSGWENGTVQLWDAVTRQLVGLPLPGHAGQVIGVAVGRAGGRGVIVSGSNVHGSYTGSVRVWDAATGPPVGEPLTGHTDRVTAVAVGRAGNRDVIVSSSDDWTVRVWDAATGQPVGEPLTGRTGPVTAVAVGRAGDRDIIVSHDGQAMWVWDAVTRRRDGPLAGHTVGGKAVAMGRAGDCDVIVSGSFRGTVWVWNAATGQPVGEPLAGHTGPVTAVAVGRAGDRDVIVSGSEDETVRVWDATTGLPIGEPLTGPTVRVTAVAVGRAGDRDVIVSGSEDETVRAWDAATRQAVGEPLTGHTRRVTAVAVGRAGGRDIIVSGSYDGTVRVWDAATGEPVGQQQFPDAIGSLALADERLAVAQGNDVVVLRVNPALLSAVGLSPSQESSS